MRVDRKERGVTMIEMAMLIGIVFVFTLNMVDIARFLMLEAILNKGAEDGLNVATKISNFDYDIRQLSVSDSRYYDFYEARRRVLDSATRLPLNTFFTQPGTASDAELIGYEHRDTEVQGAVAGSEPTLVRAAAVIRPGEVVFESTDPSKVITNMRRGPDPGNVLPAVPWRMMNGLQNNPIQIELRAKVRPFCPASLCPWFGGERILVGRAFGYRENAIPRGPLPAENPADMPAGYATASTVTTTTIGFAPVTTLPEQDPNFMLWESAFQDDEFNPQKIIFCAEPVGSVPRAKPCRQNGG